ncbi:hypothetical protein BJ170DRAFT_463140 [Xylariales sp. AK1849]|nr:hypothetical protein BJ170DRAFT_463140 [Xylariales sp. AK1849]
MSRNIRQNPVTISVKPSKRRGSDSSSSLGDLSDSDGYSAVGDISETDDDEEDVIAAEEAHLRTHERRDSDCSTPRPINEEDEEGDDEDDPEDDDEDEDEEAVDDNADWEGFSDGADESATSNQEVSVERRVRFDVPDSPDSSERPNPLHLPDSEGDTTETDDGVDGFFPDIFVAERALDPNFRRELELEDPGHSSDSGSFWDLHGNLESDIYLEGYVAGHGDFEGFDVGELGGLVDDDSTPMATPMTSQELSTAVSTPIPSPDNDDLSLDGYQSDGDTTEDEEPPPRPIRRNTRKEAPAHSSDSEPATLIKPSRGKPRRGTFNLDSSGKKPVAVVHPRTGKLMIFTPQRLRRLDLSPETFNFPFFEPVTQSSPILSNSGNLMMGAMMSSNTFGDFMNTQPFGPAEAFFSGSPSSNVLDEISEEDEDDDYEEDEGESLLKINDFINFDGDDDDDDDGEQDDDYSITPGRPTTASSDVTDLVGHLEFNPDMVGAFRRDQANLALIRSGQATRESLAFSGPFTHGTLRGIKDGRIPALNVPVSPLRKQKKLVPGMASSPLSGMSQKRKSLSEQHSGHKRQRSSIDLGPLSFQE